MTITNRAELDKCRESAEKQLHKEKYSQPSYKNQLPQLTNPDATARNPNKKKATHTGQ